MAYETGTASNNQDLLDKLKVFLTTNTDLVADGQEWEALRYTAGDTLMLKGSGLAGTDEIFVNIKNFENSGADIYNWVIQGAGGYVGANAVDDQPAQSLKCGLSLWDDSMNYWFFANGRRFIVVAKVSTFYIAGYFGLCLPFGTPSQYPYPLIIGGNLPFYNSSYNAKNYSWPNQLNTNYWCPSNVSGGISSDPSETSQLQFYWVDGSWRYAANFYTNGSETGSQTIPSIVEGRNYVWPLRPSWVRDNIDGSYTLTPQTIVTGMPSNSVMGELDGSFSVSGFSNGSENIINVDGDDYIVFQNVFRNAIKDFVAIKK